MVADRYIERARRWWEVGDGSVAVCQYNRLGVPQDVKNAIPPGQPQEAEFYTARITPGGVAVAFATDNFRELESQFIQQAQAGGLDPGRSRAGKQNSTRNAPGGGGGGGGQGNRGSGQGSGGPPSE